MRAPLVIALAAVLVSVVAAAGARSASEASGLIAFARADGVYAMRSDGSGVRPLRRGGVAAGARGLAWSPDGRRLAFSTDDAVCVMKADGSDLVRVGGSGSRPTWSPDGRRIAFAAYSNGRGVIEIVNADGSNRRQFVPQGLSRTSVAGVDWSPTGGRLAFTTPGWGLESGIYVIDTNGRNLRGLTPERTGGSGQPDWSPDGRRIVFTHAVPRQVTPDLTSLEECDEEIWIMDADGGARVQLTSNAVPDHDPVWSPDGTRIAFVGAYAGRGSEEIYVINADGSGFTRLTHNRVAEASPAWQPGAAP